MAYRYDRRLNTSGPRRVDGAMSDMTLLNIAEQTLVKRLERVTKFDRRSLRQLDRKGFVHIYDDGVALTRRGMEKAINDWGSGKREAEPGGEREAELENFIQLGKRWLANYDEPEGAPEKVADLSLRQYMGLHDALTRHTDGLCPGLRLGRAPDIRKMMKLGYLEQLDTSGRFPLSDQMFRITEKGFDLVRKHGNPRHLKAS